MTFVNANNSTSWAVHIHTPTCLLDWVSFAAFSPGLTTLVKLLICVILALSFRSLPFVWTYRVFRPLLSLRLQHAWIRFLALFKMSHSAKLKLEDDWLDSLSPIGADPFTKVVSSKQWASLDECDFNLHLSNSSYAKTLDSARFEAVLNMFPMLLPTGGWFPLAATHYHFIREIPMLSFYEIRASLGSWDQKWIYVILKFVRRTNGKKHKLTAKPISPPIGGDGRLTMVRIPGSEPLSLSSTPLPPSKPQSASETETTLKAVAAGLSLEEPDGATVHTIAVSQICFKIGRITVPPALILGLNGYTGAEGHSLASPHPEWSDAKKVMSKLHGGSPRKLKELLTGGWREVPEGERWWERTLGEGIEAQRVRNLALIEGLRRGMESAGSL